MKSLIIMAIIILLLGSYFGYFYWAIGISGILIISNIVMNSRMGGSVKTITKAFAKRLNDDRSIINSLENGDFSKLTEITRYVIISYLEANLKHYFLTQTDKDYIEEIINSALKHKNIEDYLEYIVHYTLILYYSIKGRREITSVNKDFGSKIISELITKTINKYFTIPYPEIAGTALKTR